MAIVYVVFKEGIYRHECAGVFTTLGKAKKAAISARDGDSDDYHHYDVVPFELNSKTAQEDVEQNYVLCGSYWSGGFLIENQPVYTAGCKDTTGV